MKALQSEGIRETSLSILSAGMLVQTFLTAATSNSIFEGFRRLTLRSHSSHNSSRGFRSGLWDGQSMISTVESGALTFEAKSFSTWSDDFLFLQRLSDSDQSLGLPSLFCAVTSLWEYAWQFWHSFLIAQKIQDCSPASERARICDFSSLDRWGSSIRTYRPSETFSRGISYRCSESWKGK